MYRQYNTLYYAFFIKLLHVLPRYTICTIQMQKTIQVSMSRFFFYYGKNPPAPSLFTTPRHSRLENSKIGVQGLRRFNKVVAWLPNEALVPKNVGVNEGWWKSPKGTIYP